MKQWCCSALLIKRLYTHKHNTILQMQPKAQCIELIRFILVKICVCEIKPLIQSLETTIALFISVFHKYLSAHCSQLLTCKHTHLQRQVSHLWHRRVSWRSAVFLAILCSDSSIQQTRCEWCTPDQTQRSSQTPISWIYTISTPYHLINHTNTLGCIRLCKVLEFLECLHQTIACKVKRFSNLAQAAESFL